jgi:hypothetical protein
MPYLSCILPQLSNPSPLDTRKYTTHPPYTRRFLYFPTLTSMPILQHRRLVHEWGICRRNDLDRHNDNK